jgi:hypothetical protein
VELDKVLARLISADRAVLQALTATALPDGTRLTVSDPLSSLGLTSVTVWQMLVTARLYPFFDGGELPFLLSVADDGIGYRSTEPVRDNGCRAIELGLGG